MAENINSKHPLWEYLKNYDSPGGTKIIQASIRGDVNSFNLTVYAKEKRAVVVKHFEKTMKTKGIPVETVAVSVSLSKSKKAQKVTIKKPNSNQSVNYIIVFKPSDKMVITQQDPMDFNWNAFKKNLKPAIVKTMSSRLLKDTIPDEEERKQFWGQMGKGKAKGQLVLPEEVELYPLGVVNEWLSPEEIIKRTSLYINSLFLPVENQKEFDLLFKRVLDGKTRDITIDIEKSPASAEFFEILSAVKLARLLESGEKYIIDDVLKLPKAHIDLAKKGVKIFIPKSQTFKLIDYYINYKGTTKEEDSLKVSVKAKISSPNVGTNTIKLPDVFSNSTKVLDEWFRSVMKNDPSQEGPKDIAQAALELLGSGSGKLFPVLAVSKLLVAGKNRAKQKKQILSTLNRWGSKNQDITLKNKYTTSSVLDAFVQCIRDIGPKIGNLRAKDLLIDKVKKPNQKYATIVNDVMQQILTSEDTVELTVENLVFICERVLENGSKQKSDTKYNFYQMFFDKVLSDAASGGKAVLYASPVRYATIVKFGYYSVHNWNRDYKNWNNQIAKYWLDLRGKSVTNKVGATGSIGINV